MTLVKKGTFVLAGLLSFGLVGCSSQQTQQLGLRSSTVYSSPQQMSNQELCDTYVHGRDSVHTRFAIASEWSRRGLSTKYCKEKNQELFITTAVKALAGISSETKKENANAVQPVQPVAK
ncbi:hypothetical protein [Photobacterium sanguinicancri]|uniref:hypothetical protein n=1 Tax=Photobacterium sanguinicancri TaxID=875932 RepID=UPI0021C3E32A|nr:hypothetical protein [Photobacterium sanguinicancri]